jgi:hypothetical protein
VSGVLNEEFPELGDGVEEKTTITNIPMRTIDNLDSADIVHLPTSVARHLRTSNSMRRVSHSSMWELSGALRMLVALNFFRLIGIFVAALNTLPFVRS